MEIVNHLSSAEPQARWRGSKGTMLGRCYQLICLLSEGRRCAGVAKPTGFVRRWVEKLLVGYDRSGPTSLGDRRRGNGAKPPILTPEVLAMLRERVRTLPDDGGVWTARKVATVVPARLGLSAVAEQRGWEALRVMGWTIQHPRPQHAEAVWGELLVGEKLCSD